MMLLNLSSGGYYLIFTFSWCRGNRNSS